jgi:hypothetical protein
MQVTIGRIIRMWRYAENHNVFMLLLQYNQEGATVIDNIIYNNESEEIIRNCVGKHIYIYDIDDVPNNIVIGPDGRRTGRLVLWNDDSIRLADNNHTEVGRRVDMY